MVAEHGPVRHADKRSQGKAVHSARMTHDADDSDYHLRLLVDRIPSMLAYWDAELKCRYANGAYERWFGLEAKQVIGIDMHELLGAELFALNEPHIRAALRGEEQIFERIVPGPGGARRNSLAQYIPDVVDGHVRGFLVQVTEITKLKQVEQALETEKALRQELQLQMRRRDELLHERSEMLDAFAHEVRQPLNNASAALQRAMAMLEEEGGQEAACSSLERAMTVLTRMVASVDNTLADGVLLAGGQPVPRQDVDIDLLMGLALSDIDPVERRRVGVVRATSTRTASLNLGFMRLALRNLVVNALAHANPASPVVVRISESDDPLALLIDVCDTGPGIDPELLPRLFERGTRTLRGEAMRTSHGLGLYIVRRVMQMQGGTALLHENGPTGATLRLVLPQLAP